MTTDEELERVGKRLRERERETIEQLSLNASSARPVSLDNAIGRVTRIDAIQQQQMALHGKRRLRIQLDQIRAALSRLQEGTYGECTICGEPIAPERLEFAPEAPTCIECQRRLD
jgi:DnaK suppressor protein